MADFPNAVAKVGILCRKRKFSAAFIADWWKISVYLTQKNWLRQCEQAIRPTIAIFYFVEYYSYICR